MMRLPASFASPEELCAALVEFIVAFKWLCVLRANDALLLGFDWPTDWTLLYQDDTVFNGDNWIDLVKDGLSHHSWPDSLKDFIHQCNTLKLPRKVIPSDFGTVLQDIETSSCSLDQSSSGMNRKKLHEVERFSRVIIDLVTKAGISDTATIVDVGAGQGYLTHQLSTEYPCVAVDFDQIQTVGSVSRGNNIKKGNVKDIRSRKQEEDQNVPVVIRKPVVYKTILINAEKLQALVNELEEADSTRDFVLVGLHACGDLSATAMLQTFENCPSVKLMAVVPCCFNLLTEPENPQEVCRSHGFPMSQAVQSLCKQHSLTLGYDSLNLSCQNYDKFSRQEIESNLNNHAMRSLLDLLFDYYHIDPIAKTFVTVVDDDDDDDSKSARRRYKFKLGKLPPETAGAAEKGDFFAYAVFAVSHLGLSGLLSHAQIQEFMQLPVTKNAKLKIYATHCIKSLMSRVLESLVLMDRFMALDEMNRPKEFSDIGSSGIIVKMLNLFDVAESPRNVVFLAEKQKARA